SGYRAPLSRPGLTAGPPSPAEGGGTAQRPMAPKVMTQALTRPAPRPRSASPAPAPWPARRRASGGR
ncbi:hypothetical protein FV233_24515, partial [Methylobacterium sp. WL7]